jgi:hypothetical protein
MSSFLVFLTATVLSLGVSAAPKSVDQGIRFSCQRRQLPEIKAAMAGYLKSLGIVENVVTLDERAAQGVLVYTLATPATETSTLDLAARPELAIASEKVTLSSGSDALSVLTVSQKEVLLALLQHGRLTELRGAACSVDVLAEHVALRQNIVAWAENLRWRWPNGGPAAWNQTLWDRGTPRRGVPLQDAIDDVFTHQSAYAIGCYTATKLVVVKGVLDYYDRVRESPALARLVRTRLLSDHDPLYNVEPPIAWRFEPGFDPKDATRPGKLLSIIYDVAANNFVPGDWVYFLNTDRSSRKVTGYEGSNAIYLGGRRFDDYYGENNHAFSYEEKLDEVFQWRNGVFNRERDAAKRRPLTEQDLVRLSESPRHGGLVKTWRIAPDFFEASARRSVTTQSALGRSSVDRVAAGEGHPLPPGSR